jgi:hypothetical protein
MLMIRNRNIEVSFGGLLLIKVDSLHNLDAIHVLSTPSNSLMSWVSLPITYLPEET